MNPRTTGLLLLIAAALGAFVWFHEIEGEAGRKEAEQRERQLFPDVDEKQISAIEVTTTDAGIARLERTPDGWALTLPLGFPADGFAADGMAANLAGLVREGELEDPQPPEEYGLGDGATRVVFEVGETRHALRIGDATPVGANAYASVEDGDAVYTVPGYTARSFEKSLSELREHRILAFDPSSIRSLEARWPGGEVRVERMAEPAPGEGEEGADAAAATGRWRLTAPIDAAADDETVDRLLSDLSYLRADDFVDEPPPDAEAGLAPPAFEVVLTGTADADGDPPSYRVAIGEVREGDRRLVRAATPSLYRIPADRLDGFPRETVAYRHRTLSEFPVDEAAQLDLYFRPASGDPVLVTALRSDDGWQASPEPMAPGKIARLVAELSRLKASQVLMESASEGDLAELGLSPPNTIVSVFGTAPEADEEAEPAEEDELPPAPERPRLAEIQIGEVQGSEWIVARAAGDPAVYRLDYDLADQLPVSLEALRNRFLVDPDAVEAPPTPPALDEFLTPSEESP